jgi:Ca-activated chloride channel family protein
LQEIAQNTGGKYYRATDNTTLAEIYAEINQLEKGRTTVENVVSYEEHFSGLLRLVFVLLIIELMLNWFVIRRMS